MWVRRRLKFHTACERNTFLSDLREDFPPCILATRKGQVYDDT